jgi:prophage regulatory protein
MPSTASPASSNVTSTGQNGGAETPLFLRLPTVVKRTGLGRSTIYRLIAEHQFPPQLRLAGRAVGWRSSDVQRWAESRTAGASDTRFHR